MTDNFNKYNSTVSYLYSLQKYGIKLGLSNTNKLMDILGNPQNSFKSVHIAGTNGKGSTSAAIASILQKNGFRVGLFTSPHLASFTERIRINNTHIEESEVMEIASFIHNAITYTDLNPTFFEFVTAMAFYYFSRKNVDWTVIETGMGGRLDATNVILPEVSIITNVSLDHCEFLGSNILDITNEKAGIIKPGIPVITASNIPEVVKRLSEIAEINGSGIHVYGKDFSGSLLLMDDKKISFDYSGYENYSGLSISLTGKYQLYNACTAVRTIELLREKGLLISESSIRKGLLNVKLEGRLEKVSDFPPIFIDGAHNPEAADKLSDSVINIFQDKKIILIVGIMDDKDISGILRPLAVIAESIIFTKPGYERAASPEKLLEVFQSLNIISDHHTAESIITTPCVSNALELAKINCREDNIILVTGSFYTTGEVKEIYGCKGTLSDLREQIESEK